MFPQYRSEAARAECFAYLDSRAEREWPFPFESRTLATSFGPSFVRIAGPADAPPLVLLHGAATSSLMWAPNVGALAAGLRIYAIDVIGDFGKSVCTRPLRSFDDLAAWLTEFFDVLDLRCGVNLAGISYGGSLAAEYALRHPERIGRMVLIAPGGTVLRIGARFALRLACTMAVGPRALPWVFRWLFADALREQPEFVEATLDQLRMHARCIRRALPFPGVWKDAEWRALSVPTLFLVGEHEKIYSPRKAVRRLNRVAPRVKTGIVGGAGHDLTFIRAADVNRRILEFVTGSTSTST